LYSYHEQVAVVSELLAKVEVGDVFGVVGGNAAVEVIAQPDLGGVIGHEGGDGQE
jgi:hypothetical protein